MTYRILIKNMFADNEKNEYCQDNTYNVICFD